MVMIMPFMKKISNLLKEDTKQKNEISKKLSENIIEIEDRLQDCPDVMKRKVFISDNKEAYFIFAKDIVDIDLLQRDFMNPILSMDYNELISKSNIEKLPASDIKFCYNFDSVMASIFSGNTIFLMEGMDFAVSCELRSFIKRNIQEPETEKNVKGPHEGFIELLDINIGILRRKIYNPALKFKMLTIGAITNQHVAIAYIDGVANKVLIDRLFNKINSINYDGMVVIGILEQFITDFPNSPFPQYQTTERPDRATAALLEGKLVVLLDGTPVTLIAPVSFFSFFKALDDYSFDWIFGSFMGLIRLLALFNAVFLPGIYIALLSFHYYMIPLNLLIPLAESRATVPFPPIIEALIMEIIIETLREASIRLPTYVGTSIGVVGGIIIGQAAVQAGIVSNLMVIVVSITAIASFSIPSYNMGTAIRVIRFFVMILSSIFGMIGIVVSGVMMFANLLIIESLGQPYFQPIIPFKAKDLKDVIIRLPIKFHKLRPDIAKPVDKKRGNNNE